MRLIFLLFPFIFTFVAHANYYDDFADADFSRNPVWYSSCIDAQIVTNDTLYGVRLSLLDAPECRSGSFRTASVTSTDSWWSCLLSIENIAATSGHIDFFIISSLPDLGSSRGLLLRIDLASRQFLFIYTSSLGEEILSQSPAGIIDNHTGPIRTTIKNRADNWQIQCTTPSGDLWNTAIPLRHAIQSVSSGIRLTADTLSPTPSPITTIWQINCGDKPSADDIVSEGELYINEIMYDPTPTIGMPDAEWIEIYNNTDRHISLDGFSLASSAKTGYIPVGSIPPAGYAILASDSNAARLLPLRTNTIIVNGMPALRNDGDRISLFNHSATPIAELRYDPRWISQSDPTKADGGWSLECRDITNPVASAATWGPSIHPLGATPGAENSITAIVDDTITPAIHSIGILSEYDIQIRYNKPMTPDSRSTLTLNDHIRAVTWNTPTADRQNITLRHPLTPTTPVTIRLHQILCASGYPLPDTTITIALPSTPRHMDIIFNEIMPYVDDTQSKFIELYNNSTLWFDLSHLRLSNPIPHTDSVRNTRPIATESTIIAPQQIATLAPKPHLLHTTRGLSPQALYLTAKLPSFAATDGQIILTDTAGTTIDHLRYSHRWHHHAIKDRHNISLERISALQPTTDSTNWHSASTLAGYNTAGWPNSQTTPPHDQHRPHFTCPHNTFSPNADGSHDQLPIHYTMPAPGYTLTADIYTRHGTHIARIINNHLLAATGTYHWDGTTTDGHPVPAGLYIITLRTTSPHGTTTTDKIAAIKL